MLRRKAGYGTGSFADQSNPGGYCMTLTSVRIWQKIRPSFGEGTQRGLNLRTAESVLGKAVNEVRCRVNVPGNAHCVFHV
jgi:hypothetical protein